MTENERRRRLPSPKEQLRAEEPWELRKQLKALAHRAVSFGQIVGGGVTAIYISFQVLEIGLVTQKQYNADRKEDQAKYAELSAKMAANDAAATTAIAVLDSRLTSHTAQPDTQDRTRRVYAGGPR